MDRVVICQYCNNPSKVITGKKLYPNTRWIHKKYFWICKSCDAYVGCHGKSKKPLGSLANKKLRELRKLCHYKFYEYSKANNLTKKESYKWLSEIMKLDPKHAHFGMFDIDQCSKFLNLI